jgi:hypothetical protein
MEILQRSLDLDANRVGLAPDARAVVDFAEPFPSHDNEQEIAAQQGVANVVTKVAAEGNILDVHEYARSAVRAHEAVANAPGDGSGVGASI